MGEKFIRECMGRNWSQSSKATAIKLKKEFQEQREAARLRRANEPILTAEDRKLMAQREGKAKLESIQEIIDKHFDEFGNLLGGIPSRRPLFKLDPNKQEVEVRHDEVVSTPDLMRRYLWQGWVLEHPLGWIPYPTATRPHYAPPPKSEIEEFVCPICEKPFPSAHARDGHVGSAHRSKKGDR